MSDHVYVRLTQAYVEKLTAELARSRAEVEQLTKQVHYWRHLVRDRDKLRKRKRGEIQRLRPLAKLAAKMLDEAWIGEWSDGAYFDWAVELGLIVQPTEPCPPGADCEWCDDEGERCWRYAPGVEETVRALAGEVPRG